MRRPPHAHEERGSSHAHVVRTYKADDRNAKAQIGFFTLDDKANEKADEKADDMADDKADAM